MDKSARHLRPGTFGAQLHAHRQALPVRSSREAVAEAAGMHMQTLRAIEFGYVEPPDDAERLIRLVDAVRGNRQSLVSLALSERGAARLRTDTPQRVNAAAALVLAWADMTDEQLAQVERLAFSMRR